MSWYFGHISCEIVFYVNRIHTEVQQDTANFDTKKIEPTSLQEIRNRTALLVPCW